MHFARLVEQAGVDLVSLPICLDGAYISNRIPDMVCPPHGMLYEFISPEMLDPNNPIQLPPDYPPKMYQSHMNSS